MEPLVSEAAQPDQVGQAVWYIKPELIVVVLRIMREALDGIGRIPSVRAWYLDQVPRPPEPDLTRHLCRAMIEVRDDHHDFQCGLRHQEEQARVVPGDREGGYRRFDITVKFDGQPVHEREYLSLECKFLDANDHDSHGRYVRNGVQRYVDGTYSHNHDWACMIGFERAGPVTASVKTVRAVMHATFGDASPLTDWLEFNGLLSSRHLQTSSQRNIEILHWILPLH